MNTFDYSQFIKTEAKNLGFLSCGISKAEFLEDEAPRLEKWLKEEKAECPVCRCQLKDTKDEKVEIEKVSRDDIRNNMRREYVNFLSESIHTIYENETELQLQRLLMQEYTNNE